MRATQRAARKAGTAASTRAAVAVTVAYAGTAYLAFVGVLAYAVLFLADVVVPRTVDRGGPHAGALAAVVTDAALLGLFAAQHSVMARPAVKARLRRLVPSHVERSTYVLLTSTALALAFWQWRPVPAVVWDVDGASGRDLLRALYVAGWVMVVGMTFAIDHLDLLGLRQVGRRLRGLAPASPGFRLPWPHRLVRHPMMVGFFPAFLAAPTMTAGHLLFAGLGCAYILVGVRLEERDLSGSLPGYAGYAAATPRFVPRAGALRRATGGTG